MLAGSCTFFTSCTAVTYYYWVRERNDKLNSIRMRQEVMAKLEPTHAIKSLVESAKGLTPEQAKMVTMFKATIIHIANPGGANHALRVGDFETTSWEPVEEWQKLDTTTYLPAVGRWGEGSEGRELAVRIVNHMVGLGYAEPARGPYPSKWLDRAAGLASIGLEE